MQLEQLGQVTPDRHFPLLVAFTVADGDHAPGEADVPDPELHQLGRAGAGFQQDLQHQPLFPAESSTTEAIMMAGLGHYKVIAVDYRMPPEAYFPAALDDAITVYKAVLKDTSPSNVAFFGTSAGGALTLEMVLHAKQLGLPTPGAIAPGTPMSDVKDRRHVLHEREGRQRAGLARRDLRRGDVGLREGA
jgi:acetyl esterase/lipase